MTLQQYIEMYKHPLNEESVQAILKLTEVVAEKKKKKKGKKSALVADLPEAELARETKKTIKKGKKEASTEVLA
jgi:hypothetical protein